MKAIKYTNYGQGCTRYGFITNEKLAPNGTTIRTVKRATKAKVLASGLPLIVENMKVVIQ